MTALAEMAAIFLLIFGLGPLIEWMSGKRPNFATIRLNFWAQAVTYLVNLGLMPFALAISAIIVESLGGGLVILPDESWGLLWAIPLFAFAMELADYGFHRAQHAWPLLWAMHSFHHSDRHLGATTSVRHFWAEAAIRAAIVYMPVLLILRPSPTALTIYGFLILWGNVDHLNVRWSFGRFCVLWTSPQYHRIHHAADPRLLNRNFAALFPVIDLAFGTYYRPARDEYPASGLADHQATGFLDVLFWPLRFQQDVAVPQ